MGRGNRRSCGTPSRGQRRDYRARQLRGPRLRRDGELRAKRRRAGIARADVSPARADAEGDGEVSHGAKGRTLRLSAAPGATKTDSWIDIDGGIGTFFVYASKGRREFPNETFYVDGPMEALSKGGTFVGRHICVPLEGVAVHINAFNFPCWGMLEKLAPTLLAGVPAIVKPATVTSLSDGGVFRR